MGAQDSNADTHAFIARPWAISPAPHCALWFLFTMNWGIFSATGSCRPDIVHNADTQQETESVETMNKMSLLSFQSVWYLGQSSLYFIVPSLHCSAFHSHSPVWLRSRLVGGAEAGYTVSYWQGPALKKVVQVALTHLKYVFIHPISIIYPWLGCS